MVMVMLPMRGMVVDVRRVWKEEGGGAVKGAAEDGVEGYDFT